MKKTLIALSVLVAAGSVNAATLVSEDGLDVAFYGDLEVNYKQAVGDNQEAKFNLDDADFGVSVSTAVSSELAVIGKTDFSGEGDAVELDNLYVGIKSGAVTATAGQHANLVDDIGISTDQEIGGTYEAWGGIITDETDQVLKVVYDDGGMFYGGLSVTQDKDGVDSGDDFQQMTLRAGVRSGDVDVRAYLVDAEDGADEADAMTVEARYSMDNVSFAANYATASANDVDTDAMGLTVSYSMDATTVSGGWSTSETDGADDLSQWYANVSYTLTSNASVFAEIADTDADNVDMGYAAGLRVTF